MMTVKTIISQKYAKSTCEEQQRKLNEALYALTVVATKSMEAKEV